MAKSTLTDEQKVLLTETADLHHKAEEHPFGAAMSAGELSPQEWADWMAAMLQIYLAVDPMLPVSGRRSHDLFMDLLKMKNAGVSPVQSVEALAVANRITLNPTDIDYVGGVSYILLGANLRGGQLIRKALTAKGVDACSHLFFVEEDKADGEVHLDALRSSKGVVNGAREMFTSIVAIMDEIWSRYRS